MRLHYNELERAYAVLSKEEKERYRDKADSSHTTKMTMPQANPKGMRKDINNMFDMLKREVCNNFLFDFIVLTNKMSSSMLWSNAQDVKPFMWLFVMTLRTTLSPRSTWVLKQKGSSRTYLVLIPVSL